VSAGRLPEIDACRRGDPDTVPWYRELRTRTRQLTRRVRAAPTTMTGTGPLSVDGSSVGRWRAAGGVHGGVLGPWTAWALIGVASEDQLAEPRAASTDVAMTPTVRVPSCRNTSPRLRPRLSGDPDTVNIGVAPRGRSCTRSIGRVPGPMASCTGLHGRLTVAPEHANAVLP
jgi:hypothetical protein